ncbi:MAG TPA: SulP family inorganic anion transporter [Rhodocyclaceae bacterium]|nr:SulP family inorganic anion transporter [Rhodocyclaceae bacterium]
MIRAVPSTGRSPGAVWLGGGHQAAGDVWGALAAMLVALPASIAFGVTVYAAIGPAYAASGALAGIIGATVVGLIASAFGGTDRLISAPCAPAAAVLSAFAIDLVKQGVAPGTIVLLLVMLGIVAGAVQMLLGFVGVGRLIRYIPFPVVSGYLSGVGLIIIGSQIPKFLGIPGKHWWDAVLSPWLWDWRGIAIGGVTVGVALITPRLTHKVPSTILGIVAGLIAYLLLALQDASLWQLENNPLVIGSLGVGIDGFFASVNARWLEIGNLRLNQIAGLFGSALTLAVLLSIDTLKTCVVLDQMTRGRHDSNRELIAQGLANVAAVSVGGMPGAGTMGATMVSLSSGAVTRMTGVIEGVFALIAALLLGSFIAWIPVATLAGILIVIGVRMIDKEPLRFLQSNATVFDFAVVMVVVIVAITVGLIAASAVGVALAIILFLREQIGSSVVRHKMYVNQISSTWYRPEDEMHILSKKGDQAVIFELQGSLFFGNTQALYSELEQEINTRSFVIIDLKRVQSVDVTAAHMLNQVRDAIKERGAVLIFSNIRENLPNGRNLREFFEQTGLLESDGDSARIFPELDSAIAWVEDRILGERELAPEIETPMQLQEMDIFVKHKDETLKDLEARMQLRTYQAGDAVYVQGEAGDELFWVRRGAVHIMAPLGAGRSKHIASYGRGDFFGGMSFLDNQLRNNDAVAVTTTEVYVLSLEQFNQIAEHHKKLALQLVTAMARTLAMRLKYAETELTMLQEY